MHRIMEFSMIIWLIFTLDQSICCNKVYAKEVREDENLVTGSCNKDNNAYCDPNKEPRIKWHEFDWKSYIAKDLKPVHSSNPFETFGIHLPKSIAIGINRTVPDNRPKQCKGKTWDNGVDEGGTTFPSISLIITYINEPRSTLLRTLVSVYERTAPNLLKEIILVDDNNEDKTVGKELKKLDKVRLIRNREREGLIRSRVKASKRATGEVLVFLDSHCEVEPGWLEPLLTRIMDNPKRLVCPVIENINFRGFNFEPVSTYLRGGFSWRLDFFWEWLPPHDRARRLRDPTSTFKTPAIAGGLFAINRNWFLELGTYDMGMDIWGGENIELSWRVWMCGGEMEIVPCSKVGHIYKSRELPTPYSYPKGAKATLACNNRRAAETWLDEYKILHDITLSKDKLNLECGNVTERRQIRDKLQCKSFDWYLNNIYPELMVPGEGDFAFGSIHWNLPTWLKCLDRLAPGEELMIGSQNCIQTYYPQRYRLTSKGHIAQDDFCLTLSTEDEVLKDVVNEDTVAKIRSNIKDRKGKSMFYITSQLCIDEGNSELQLWERYRPSLKVYKETGFGGYQLRLISKSELCFDTSEMKDLGLLVAKKCDVMDKYQRFQFDYQFVKVNMSTE